MLQAEQITVRYGTRTALDSLSFTLEENQWLMLVGPNGAGKSTLIRALAQNVPYTGIFTLQGHPLNAMKPAERARRIGFLSQQHSVQYAYTVEEIVRLGRYAHTRGFLSHRDADGDAAVAHALELTGMEGYRHTNILTLSGGELQRAFLAQVFAQQPDLLVLDEPANHLDLPYQQRIFDLIDSWREQPGHAVLSVVHDLGLALRYGTHAVLLDDGHCVSCGKCADVLARENLSKVYRMDVYGWMREQLKLWE
ncbi:MAG: ABC transporter ATP-binding protein [Clostridia bacterium]|nr:ABC transporter ATP-binding protein [Clostridia bacterium]